MMFFLYITTTALAEEVKVAVAANFIAPMEEISREFTKDTGYDVQLTSGASGKFYSQIKNGAPFQILLSADQDKPIALANEGLGVQGTRFTYAIGKLVLWSANSSLIDRHAAVLTSDKFHKIAIANPQLAPYGAAAIETLSALKLLSKIEPKMVIGESIGQTYQFVSSGNAELGFIALSQITKSNKIISGSAWVVPEKYYTPIRQDAILLTAGKDSIPARQLLLFLQSPKAKTIIRSYGYSIN